MALSHGKGAVYCRRVLPERSEEVSYLYGSGEGAEKTCWLCNGYDQESDGCRVARFVGALRPLELDVGYGVQRFMLCDVCMHWLESSTNKVLDMALALEIVNKTELFIPKDMDAAFKSWGANCGPCSLAAALSMELADLRTRLVGFQSRKYMNATHMKDALDALKVQYRWARGYGDGLCFIQWGGFERLPVPVQYKHTHWIAARGDMVFEVNADGWVPYAEWCRVMPYAMKEAVVGCDGKWHVRSRFELGPQKRRPRGAELESRAQWGM